MNLEQGNIFDVAKYNEYGLIPAIAQDSKSKDILMMAWMNEDSIRLTLDTGFVHYFSRSRQKIWKKGEISGQFQKIENILLDCDFDCLILKIKQVGVACHTGRRSCFFNDIDKKGDLKINQEVIVSNEQLYKK